MNLRNQKLPFMFEYWPAGWSRPGTTFILPINPETYKIIHPTRANVTQTKGGGWEDNAGPGLPKIFVQGTFGYLGSLPGGGGKHYEGREKSGWDLFKEFEAQIFFAFYKQFGTGIDVAETDVNFGGVGGSGPPYADLRFYNFCDEDFFSIQIGRFEVKRSTQRRFLYEYVLEMTALKRIGDEDALDSLAESLAEIPEPDAEEVGLWGRLLEGYTHVSGQMSDIINRVESVRDNLETVRSAVSAFRQGISDLIEAPFGLIGDTVKTIDLIIEKVVSLEDLPHEFTDLMRREKRNMLALGLKPHLFASPSTAAGETATEGVTEILTAALPSGQTAQNESAIGMDTPEATLFDPSMEAVDEISAAEEPVLGTDSLETVAARTLGDAREWRRIAMLNDLEYPYLVGDDPAQTVSPSLGESALAEDVAAGRRTVSLVGSVPSDGETLLIAEGDLYEFATVESVDTYEGAVVALEGPLENAYTIEAVVTRHARRLSVLRPGDKLRIPGSRRGGPTILGSEEDFAAQLYGTDEYLDGEGRHDSDGVGDVAVISGLDNLTMQLRHRLMTPRGGLAHLGHPEYGSILPLLIGEIGTDYVYERARLEAKICLLQDPRIERVASVGFTVNGTAVYLEADVRPIGQGSSRRLSLLLVS